MNGCIRRRTQLIWSILLVATMALIMALLPTVSYGLPALVSLDSGNVVITATGYSQAGSPEIAYTGDYVITNANPTANTLQVASGTHQITLRDANIAIPPTTATDTTSMVTLCAFSITGNANVTLTLEGNNTLTSAGGYAGLYVEQGASLVIDGRGTLQARGGAGRPVSSGTPAYAGGAGIGGNGYNDTIHFGTVTIGSGTINATGGATALNVNYGGGAGIGSGGGGIPPSPPSSPNPTGTIVIDGGNITAVGGVCINASDTCGGAGIGSGGMNQEAVSYVNIEIHGGMIQATGSNDGAGIGSGANLHVGGNLAIDGGRITATGGDEGDGSTWGGAGIGAGDMGWAKNITIGGDAVVTAKAGGAAAGIGGGNCGGLWDVNNDVVGTIHITGNADITTWGGTSGTRGGAGIGAGRSYSASFQSNGGVVTVDGHASVTAYAGSGASAIGAGAMYDYATAIPGEDVLTIGDDVSLLLFNRDSEKAAFPPLVQISSATSLASFTLSESPLTLFPAPGDVIAVTGGGDLTWTYRGTVGNYQLEIFESSGASDRYDSSHLGFGNWAVLTTYTEDTSTPTGDTGRTGSTGRGRAMDDNPATGEAGGPVLLCGILCFSAALAAWLLNHRRKAGITRG